MNRKKDFQYCTVFRATGEILKSPLKMRKVGLRKQGLIYNALHYQADAIIPL